MFQYHPDLLAAPVPRYTSYPTAAQFTDDVGPEALEARLASVRGDARISLYLHIPYCHDICWYCGCNTGAATRPNRLAAYVDALEQEIAMVAARLGGRGRVTQIAFGGGSPNSLPLVDWLRINHQLLVCFDTSAASLSVELDPRRLDQSWIDAIARMGISRVNLGVQTFTPHVQQAIGRIQPVDMVEAAVARFKRNNVTVGFDLMYGLPGQSEADLAQTLETTISLAPSRIALFGYAHMPHLLHRQRRIAQADLPGMAERFAMATRGHAMLTAAGYRAIGFDHFALPQDPLAQAAANGTLRRNFQGFTEDDSDMLIGLGASAISQFPDLIVQNEKNAGAYREIVAGDRLPATRGVVRSLDDQERGRLIERLLCDGMAPVGDLCGSESLDRFVRMGMVKLGEGRIKILPDAQPYARSIAACFDTYLRPAETRFSHAV
ncbi:coproporphyrinogen dehydrogenase [Sphingobium terrigena]|uniref:Coproporphyrinogen-III oxidase n=1 Tax=Sphingobium terrigena TaxID=2304063 RepID=A0A418YXI9_9SPHN|nr:radical SAM protein [Sphingobium terrigena]RJG57331.1 coproporphyrinogen dehydrogenase [Sphingobium terrigena]